MSIPIDPTKLRFGSVCSGIEAASCAWNELGWRAAWFSEIEPFPCELLKQRFPDVPNYGDMTALPERILSGEIEAPDILCGGTPCFVAGTMVLTQDGYKPIENIAVGDMVMTHKGRLRKVLRTGSKLAEVGTLKMVGHKGFTCTPNHPFLSVLKKDREPIDENAPFDWIDAKDLPGRQWCSPVRYEKTLCSFRSPKLTNLKDLLYFAGFYVGDGYIRGWTGKTKKAVVLCLNEAKLNLFRARFPHLCGTVTSNGTSLKVTIYDTALANWLTDNFGELAHQKKIPSWLYGSKHLSEFVTGYLLTDGCSQGNRLSFSTTSKALAYGICDLLNLSGLTASTKYIEVKPKKTIEGRTVNQRPWWQIRGFENSRKSRYANGYLCRTVQSYEQSNSTSQVFNLEVEEDNSYIAEGAAVHNCQAFSVAGKRLSLDDARGNLSLVFCQIADAIDAVRTRLRYPPHIIFWENVPGVLNTKDNAFGCFLGELTGASTALKSDAGRWPCAGFVAGPKRTLAWRTLDSQHFGVPQRRRRVFVIASAREDFDPSEILFESDGLFGDSAKSGSEGEETTRTALQNPSTSSEGCRRNVALPYSDDGKVPTVTSKWAKGYGGPTTGNECSNMIIENVQPTMLHSVAPTLTSGSGTRHFSGNQEIFSGKFFVFQPTKDDDEK